MDWALSKLLNAGVRGLKLVELPFPNLLCCASYLNPSQKFLCPWNFSKLYKHLWILAISLMKLLFLKSKPKCTDILLWERLDKWIWSNCFSILYHIIIYNSEICKDFADMINTFIAEAAELCILEWHYLFKW